MNLFPWLTGCWLAAAAICAAIGQTYIAGVRSWVAPEGGDSIVHARAFLDAMPPNAVAIHSPPEFRVQAGRTTWYALDLSAFPRPAVLELTHPALRVAEVYIPERHATLPFARGGRELPGELRTHNRFPATLDVPASGERRTVYVRVLAPVDARGTFALQPRHSWELLSRLELACMSIGFGLAALAAVYALGRAVALRSTAYFLYCLLGITTAAAGMFITGLGEATVWPALAPWRGQASALLACIASGLALLLAERAFALEISSPRFGLLLRLLGVALPLAGIAALWATLPVLVLVSHAAAGTAIVMGLASIWMAWKTHNRPAAWLLAGYAPVVVGVSLTTLAIAGALPFEAWTLMALPVTCVLEVPFNLHGLKLLEQRRVHVNYALEKLDHLAGHTEETRDEIAERLALPKVDLPPEDAGATLVLLRFAGLAPGSSTVRGHDSLKLEEYFQTMMAAGLRPGSLVGRWSYNELVFRDLNHTDDAKLDGLITSLFAQALRCERFGIPPHEPRPRIAFVKARAAQVPVGMLTRKLAKALDDPSQRDSKRIEIESWED
jgi:hypothetical protein